MARATRGRRPTRRIKAPAPASERIMRALLGARWRQVLRSAALLAGAMALMLAIGVVLGLGLGRWLAGDGGADAAAHGPVVYAAHGPAVTPEPEPYHPPPLPEDALAPAAAVMPPPRAVAPPGPESIEPLPAWQRFAVPAPDVSGRPMIAIVIDDMGIDRRRSGAVIDLPGPLTTAFLSYANDLPQQTRSARERGHELLVHMAMEPMSDAVDPGPHVLRVAHSDDQIRARVLDVLGRFDGVVGVNNHMGSRFTADPHAMRVVLGLLKERGLLFLDSVTTGETVAGRLAGEMGIPHAERHVFLDNRNEVAAVRKQLAQLEEIARSYGYAVGIGHPRDATIAALRDWLPRLERRGFALVPLSAVVRHRQGAQG